MARLRQWQGQVPRRVYYLPAATTETGIRYALGGTDPRPPPPPPPVILSLRSAYRQLYRTALQAVRFSTPARYQIRSILRDSFRNSPSAAFSQRRIENTIAFLEQAREHNGYEHKILRNILHVRYWKDNVKRERTPTMLKQNNEVGVELRQTIPGHFTATLDMFNESLDLCLRV